MKSNKPIIHHPLAPIFNAHAKILILGSFPSVKSREEDFYYAHPRNRFWPMLQRIYGEEGSLSSVLEKEAFLKAHDLALWDVISSCTIRGSADDSIGDVKINDLSPILQKAPIERILLNGQSAKKYYDKYILPKVTIPYHVLPSTSPANAAWSLDDLVEKWSTYL